MTESEIKLALEKVLRRVQERRVLKRYLAGAIKRLEADVIAYNVDDTSKEKPDVQGITDWDEYWKFYVRKKLTNDKCALCGVRRDATNRVGAHIRLDGERDNTKDAWIALLCKSCNGLTNPLTLHKDSWIVRTTMSVPHKNVQPKKG